MGRRISLTFPELPYRELGTNVLRRIHWTDRSDYEAAARGEARLMAKPYDGMTPMEYAEVEYIFTLPTKRVRDLDGLITATKAWLDGVVDAGILMKDDCWHVKKLTASVELGSEAKTVIILTEIE